MDASTMLNHFLDLAGYPNIAGTYDRQLLLEQIERAIPGYLNYIQEKCQEEGKSTLWRVMSSQTILQLICEIDAVIAPSGQQSPIRCGIKPVTNPSQVRIEEDKLRSLAKLSQEIGINRTAVVLLISPPNIGFRNQILGEKIVNRFIENVVYGLNDQSINVRSYAFGW